MEEDIEILEDFIKYYDAEVISKKRDRFLSVNVDRCDIQALENLIKEYKRLKNDNAVLVADMIRKSIAESIPKSKIKEKIEELEKQIDDLMQNGDVYNDNVAKYNELKLKIEVLQELLGDE